MSVCTHPKSCMHSSTQGMIKQCPVVMELKCQWFPINAVANSRTSQVYNNRKTTSIMSTQQHIELVTEVLYADVIEHGQASTQTCMKTTMASLLVNYVEATNDFTALPYTLAAINHYNQITMWK